MLAHRSVAWSGVLQGPNRPSLAGVLRECVLPFPLHTKISSLPSLAKPASLY
jgi:hypothetical protein